MVAPAPSCAPLAGSTAPSSSGSASPAFPSGAAPSRSRHRAVAFHSLGTGDQHRVEAASSVARRLADLLALPFHGAVEPALLASGAYYVVPVRTLCPASAAEALGIRGCDDFFGGIVPYPFVATKCVSHGLVRPGAARPEGWVESLADRIEDAVLPGHTAFDLDDAREAARRLLGQHGPVRIKAPSATGGGGQSRHADLAGVEARLRESSPERVADEGIVVEIDLDEDATWSIGTVSVGGQTAAYYGRQSTTTDNDGQVVYGGSVLNVIRGGWDELIAADLPEGPHEAARLARCYHDAMHDAYPGLVASRCNYDVITGRDAGGRLRSAVLEQSWRLGGASGAEIAALLAMRDDPSLEAIEVSTHEVYGDPGPPPSEVLVDYHGEDPAVGWILKYVRIHR